MLETKMQGCIGYEIIMIVEFKMIRRLGLLKMMQIDHFPITGRLQFSIITRVAHSNDS
jgi:hypothetical protein